MTEQKLKWVIIKINKRVIWIKRDEVIDAQYLSDFRKDNKVVKLYKVFLNDGSVIPQCELENDEIYEELIKKDLTKDK